MVSLTIIAASSLTGAAIVVDSLTSALEEHLEMTSSIMEFLKKQGFKGQFRGGGIP